MRIHRNSHYRISLLAEAQVGMLIVSCLVNNPRATGRVGVYTYDEDLYFTHSPLEGAFAFVYMCSEKEGFSMKTKSTARRILATLMAVLMCALLMLSLSGCKETPADTNVTTGATDSVSATSADEYAEVWANALYTEDKTFGEGKNTFDFQVVIGEHNVTFTINTDKTIVGQALIDNNLIAGDQGDFGLYVKTVNGILADYDIDASYWGFYKDGEIMMTGVDMTDIEQGAHYEMVYTK